MELYLAGVDRFPSEKRTDLHRVLYHLLREGRGTGFRFKKIERFPLFPEDPEGNKFEEVGQMGPRGLNDLLDLEACADTADGGSQDV